MIDIKQGNCLTLMNDIPPHSIDMILCDLPYEITGKHWDIAIPFEGLWAHYKRIIKQGGHSFIWQTAIYKRCCAIQP